MPHHRRVFLSYGRDEYAILAQHIKRDLELRGHEVWFDEERLRLGRDWEIAIEEGLDWVTHDPNGGCVVLLMTPYSVRRPDGFCLNEIARAAERRIRVIPVLVAPCEAPLSLARLQHLDMQECFRQGKLTDAYQRRFDQLADALESGNLDFEGSYSRLRAMLEPMSFEADMDRLLTRFIGREWVFELVDEWLDTPGASRVFWISGEPGAGKSALAVWLIRHRQDVVAYHLCRYGHARKADPRRIVLSLVYQLSLEIPGYAEALSALRLEELRESDAETLFDDLITQPLACDTPVVPEPRIVIIDALVARNI